MRICTMLFEDENGHDLVVAVAPRGAHFLTQTPLAIHVWAKRPQRHRPLMRNQFTLGIA
jgi:hypothetical protein